ncbi:MAG: hypothetical protein RL061_1219, partial [Pseudomonadota bacterium]
MTSITNTTPIAIHSHTNSLERLPNEWQRSVAQTLNDNESVVAVLELDLNEQLHFARGLVCLTNQGLIACKEHSAAWSRWPFSEDLKLQLHDHAGVANLELLSKTGRLASWRFTLAQNPLANRLLQHFQIELAKFLGKFNAELAEATQPLCPTCWVPLPPDQDECPACSSENLTPPSTWTLLRLWRFAKPYKGQLFAGFALTLASTAATLVPPYLTMPLMDDILLPYQNGQDIDVNLTLLYLGALLGAAILAWVLGWAKTYILALVSERIGADLRTTTYQHLMKLSLEYFGGKRTGDLMARIGSESDRICLFLSMHLLDFATDVLMILMTAVILISIDPWLALVTLAPLPFIGWAIHVVRDKLRYGFEKIDRIWSEVTSVLADTIPGVRVVKAFAQEERESDRFRLANEHNLAVNDRVNRVWALFSPTITLLTEIGLLVVWAFGIWQIANDAITVGMLTACLAYIGRFYTRLDSMSRIVAFTQQAATASKRIFDILDHVSSVPESTQPIKLTKVEGLIELSNVGFRYGNRSVTRGINLKIAPGEMIGLVGHSGSGKSTLVNLICRFYDAAEGTIRLDGVDIRSIAVADYRRHIGLVLQEPFLFFGTIAENIAYGKPNATR